MCTTTLEPAMDGQQASCGDLGPLPKRACTENEYVSTSLLHAAPLHVGLACRLLNRSPRELVQYTGAPHHDIVGAQ